MSFSADRREFLQYIVLLLLGAASCTPEKAPRKRVVSLSIASIPRGLTPYPMYGIALRRDREGLAACSLFCTHQSCMLKPVNDGDLLFECPCHGSRFSQDGKPQLGPATKALSFYKLTRTAPNLLKVHLNETVSSDWRLSYP